ncbi:MAG TPA: hypothetical protein VFE78_16645, partial [Gemmataceae bacterium]|nr:hypothetical protein [Gemmataceae bacterium]
MDRRQMVLQRARELLGERVEDVLHAVRQDRQEMRGWQEPAHVRAVVRRTVRDGGPEGGAERTAALAELEFGRAAAEPDPGQQREATGQLLEAGAAALEKLLRNQPAEVTGPETL